MRNLFDEFTTGFAPVLFGMMVLGATIIGGVFFMGALLF
jgi:hypothetical protein